MGDITRFHLPSYALLIAFDLRLCGSGRNGVGVLVNAAENEALDALYRFQSAIDA